MFWHLMNDFGPLMRVEFAKENAQNRALRRRTHAGIRRHRRPAGDGLHMSCVSEWIRGQHKHLLPFAGSHSLSSSATGSLPRRMQMTRAKARAITSWFRVTCSI